MAGHLMDINCDDTPGLCLMFKLSCMGLHVSCDVAWQLGIPAHCACMVA
jgi:hypothetical protein